MNSSTKETLTGLVNSATSLTTAERTTLRSEIAQSSDSCSKSTLFAPLLLNQQQAAQMLNVDRTTIWRLMQYGILRPVELSPGTQRYRIRDIEALAEHGYRHLLKAKRPAA